MESQTGAFLLSGLAPADRNRFGWFARFFSVGDDSTAASTFVSGDSQRGHELAAAFLRHLCAEGISLDGQRLQIGDWWTGRLGNWSVRPEEPPFFQAAARQIKGGSRKKKQALIGGDWAEISRLASRRTPFPSG